MWVALSLLYIATAANAQTTTFAPMQVGTEMGLVRGQKSDDTIIFQGIPYAQPPVGELRWKPPQSTKPWQQVLDATVSKPDCMQTPAINPMSEDCLYLSIWRPSSREEDRLPVVVWIHGGSFVRGGISGYPGHVLAKQGVIVVAFNYRVGAFGFFAHPALSKESPDVRANYGYLDQIAALKWVKRNIAHFGGDPDKITILGESSGGEPSLVLYTAPMAKDLFSQAILDLSLPVPKQKLLEAEKDALLIAQSLGVKSKGEEALAKLRALPAKKIAESKPSVKGVIMDGLLITGSPKNPEVPVLNQKNIRETDQQAAINWAHFAKTSTLPEKKRDLATEPERRP